MEPEHSNETDSNIAKRPAGDDVQWTPADIDTLRRILAAMYRHLPEVRRIRPEQFAEDDPMRVVMEEFLRSQQTRGQNGVNRGDDVAPDG